MDRYYYFKEGLKQAVAAFRITDPNEKIRIVSHLDCDGISSAAILIRALERENRTYTISIVQQLNEKVMKQLLEETFTIIFFTDLGSSQISLVETLFKGKKVFVLDHHELDVKDIVSQEVLESKYDFQKAMHAVMGYQSVVHVNPVLFGIDGGREICGAGITYMFAKSLNSKNTDLAHIAVIGAIGEVQEHNGFLRLNNEILHDAITSGKLSVKKGFRFFGLQTKPLHKVLEHSSDPYIPGVSGSESSAIQLLTHIGIDPKQGKGWKKVSNLSDEDSAKLASAIIMQRMQDNHENPEDIFGNIYTLNDEKEGSSFRDAKEFATLLNSCGRLHKASLGIGACLGDVKAKRAALDNLTAYRKELLKAITWFKKSKQNGSLVSGNGFIILNAKDNILSTVTGTMASIVAKSNELKEGTVIVSMARTTEATVKISTRIAGTKKEYPIDLSTIMSTIIAKIDGASSGGHFQAAGAVIPLEKEDEFIGYAQTVLTQYLSPKTIILKQM